MLATACRTIQAINNGPGYANGIDTATVGGSDNDEQRVLPPVGYDHNGDWSVLRSAPSLVRYQKPEVRSEPRCVENSL